ncbi:capsid assembly scaffolding protein Gp46 family protein [Enterococcus thailandicus]|uniref:capsid assembly scaffolding protein Gp46 family protein n=1 Tax=Enterococcus thailandicus TaxID=417368 RepID=UPI0034DD39AD
MSDFKPIETQEALDKIIKDRLAREREKYADYDKLKSENESYESKLNALQTTIDESNAKIKAHDDTVADLNKKIAGYETASLRTRIAIQNGLPIDLADRLVGDDEESIKADAERLAGFVSKKQQTPPPLKNNEKNLGEGKDGAYKNLLNGLNLEGE